MPIYQATTKVLHEIINEAQDGLMMVPNIQRAYVWTPDKIIRLIDTFLKGWPFSTLLLWDTGLTNHAHTLVPNGPFKRRVSRVEDGNDDERNRKFPESRLPGNITMILDGQQRIQSALLAFSSHDAGLYLLDKDWAASFNDNGEYPYRGQAVKNRWCYGQLYLNLTELIKHLDSNRRGYSLRRSTDWTKVFEWAIPDDRDGVGYGGTERRDGYDWPLVKLSEKNIGNGRNRFVHASVLWEKSAGFQNRDENTKFSLVNDLLTEQLATVWDSEDELEMVKDAIFGLLNLFSFLREERISCLQLQTQTASGYGENYPAYSEAVVNIFNRLNAAGMALSKDEITSSWIRNSWEQLPDNGTKGNEIYSKMRERFKDYDYKKLDDENIVKILNILWAVFGAKNGKDNCRLFSDSDLLAGAAVKEMTEWVHTNWVVINNTLESVSKFLIKSRLQFNYHFKSVNLIYCMMVYRFGFELCVTTQNLTMAERLSIQNDFDLHAKKWILITLFSSKWGKSSDSDLASFMKHCYIWLESNAQTNNWDNLKLWSDNLFQFVNEQSRIVAKKYVENFETLEQYTTARALFFAWNQSVDRFAYYGEERMTDPSLDHIISQNSWENSLRKLGLLDNEKYLQCIHDIGNLNELGRVDNSKKNANSLSMWLTHASDDRKKIRQDELIRICKLFSIPERLSSPNLDTKENIDFVVDAIRERSSLIKQNVLDFLQLN